jgi:hypothetical protein
MRVIVFMLCALPLRPLLATELGDCKNISHDKKPAWLYKEPEGNAGSYSFVGISDFSPDEKAGRDSAYNNAIKRAAQFTGVEVIDIYQTLAKSAGRSSDLVDQEILRQNTENQLTDAVARRVKPREWFVERCDFKDRSAYRIWLLAYSPVADIEAEIKQQKARILLLQAALKSFGDQITSANNAITQAREKVATAPCAAKEEFERTKMQIERLQSEMAIINGIREDRVQLRTSPILNALEAELKDFATGEISASCASKSLVQGVTSRAFYVAPFRNADNNRITEFSAYWQSQMIRILTKNALDIEFTTERTLGFGITGSYKVTSENVEIEYQLINAAGNIVRTTSSVTRRTVFPNNLDFTYPRHGRPFRLLFGETIHDLPKDEYAAIPGRSSQSFFTGIGLLGRQMQVSNTNNQITSEFAAAAFVGFQFALNHTIRVRGDFHFSGKNQIERLATINDSLGTAEYSFSLYYKRLTDFSLGYSFAFLKMGFIFVTFDAEIGISVSRNQQITSYTLAGFNNKSTGAEYYAFTPFAAPGLTFWFNTQTLAAPYIRIAYYGSLVKTRHPITQYPGVLQTTKITDLEVSYNGMQIELGCSYNF